MPKILVLAKIIEGDLNPFDGAALEAALRVKNAEVTVISMCPKTAEPTLRALTRLGVHHVTLLTDRVYAGSDTLATAYILSLAVKRAGFDMIFCGRQTTDGDTGQVGPCLAEMLGISCLTNVMKEPEIGENEVKCTTRFGEESAPVPALLTFERMCNLRAPSIFSREKDIEILTNDDIGADPVSCGLGGSPTRVLSVEENDKGRRRCTYISSAELPALLEALAGERAKTEEYPDAENKMEHIAVVGKKPYARALALAKKVTVIESTDFEEICAQVKALDPDAVLWPADLWGRRTAPRLSARLSCGLCADCTDLETDGETLFMHRPARSGNVVAKIKCVTRPQTATVRCADGMGGLIVAAGKGIEDKLEAAKALAEKYGAELCASRPLVDDGKMPYSSQIGLTGRNAAPAVYLAIGISGAVRHTCAIENAGKIIAWNPDKDARIFDYADFGIVEEF